MKLISRFPFTFNNRFLIQKDINSNFGQKGHTFHCPDWSLIDVLQHLVHFANGVAEAIRLLNQALAHSSPLGTLSSTYKHNARRIGLGLLRSFKAQRWIVVSSDAERSV